MDVKCDPFTAFGLISDNSKPSTCWSSMLSIPCLVAEISALESGKTSTLLVPEEDDM